MSIQLITVPRREKDNKDFVNRGHQDYAKALRVFHLCDSNCRQFEIIIQPPCQQFGLQTVALFNS